MKPAVDPSNYIASQNSSCRSETSQLTAPRRNLIPLSFLLGRLLSASASLIVVSCYNPYSTTDFIASSIFFLHLIPVIRDDTPSPSFYQTLCPSLQPHHLPPPKPVITIIFVFYLLYTIFTATGNITNITRKASTIVTSTSCFTVSKEAPVLLCLSLWRHGSGEKSWGNLCSTYV